MGTQIIEDALQQAAENLPGKDVGLILVRAPSLPQAAGNAHAVAG